MQALRVIGFAMASVILVLGYQNCTGVHESDASLSSFDACNLLLKDEFANGYHQFLKQNCNGCHISAGTGNGTFADADLNLAFDAFNVRGYELVESRALDRNHQPPFTGPQHQAAIDELDIGWVEAKAQADLCIANAGVTVDNDIDQGIVPTDPQPTTYSIETFIKLTNADKDEATLTWDLSNEILNPRTLSFPGAQLQVTIQSLSTVTGEKSYVIKNPRLRAGDDPLQFQYLAVKINNKVISEATSFHQINRKVPANQQRDLATSAMVFRYDIRPTDTISILIGRLERITFDPPTFAELIDPSTGVFGVNCMSCHDGANNPSGGFDISTRDAVLTQLKAAPYNPNQSEIFKRINDTQRPMPQGGPLLPAADIEQVLWWIQDGCR